MRYIAGGMIVLFLVSGVGLLLSALRATVLRFRYLGAMERIIGVVMSVEQRIVRNTTPTNGHGSTRTTYKHFPVIRFTPAAGGAPITFTSLVGDTWQRLRSTKSSTPPITKFKAGQRLPVLYHAQGMLPPMVDSWRSVWGEVVTRVFTGIIVIGSALVIFMAFGDRIFPR